MDSGINACGDEANEGEVSAMNTPLRHPLSSGMIALNEMLRQGIPAENISNSVPESSKEEIWETESLEEEVSGHSYREADKAEKGTNEIQIRELKWKMELGEQRKEW